MLTFGLALATCIPVCHAVQDAEPEFAKEQIKEVIEDVRFSLELSREARGNGDLAEARVHVEGALEVVQTLGGLEDPMLLGCLMEIDGEATALGLLSTQVAAREWIFRIREVTLPPDHADLLGAKLNLAHTRFSLGDLEGAHALLEHVHAAWERLLAPDHPNLLTAKLNLANTSRELGDLEGALALDEAVHAARERLLPPDHPSLLTTKLNLAVTRRALGDLEGVRELEEYVHATWQRLLPPDDPDLLTAKLNLAITRRDLGDLEGALALVEAVHAARERLLPPDHPSLLTAKLSLAITRRALGDLEGALALVEVVHAAWERLLPPDHPSLLTAKLNLANTRGELGDLEGALALVEAVHAAWERLLAPDHPDLLTAKLYLAITRGDLGDLEGARELTGSLLNGQLTRAAALRAQSPRVARSAALRELHRLPEALFWSEVTVSDPPDPLDAEIFAVLESLRLVSTSSSEVALATTRFPGLKHIRNRLADARTALNDLGLSPPDEASALENWRMTLVKLADDRDELERELRSRLAEKGVFTSMITSAAVARALEDGTAVVTLFRYPRRFETDPETGETPPSVDSLLAFVVTPDAAVRRVELGPSRDLEKLTERWREALGKPVERGVSPIRTDLDEEELGRLLREKLLDPCLATYGEERPQRLHIVLDDFLHLVPIDALPWTDGRRVGEVLAIRHEVSMERLVAPPEPAAASGTLVALGGVDFGAEEIEVPSLSIVTATPPSEERSGGSEHFEPLLQSRLEVEALGLQFTELVGGEPLVLLNEKASKKALVELASKALYLHVATHGWFAPERFKSMRDSVEEQGDELFNRLLRAEETLRGFAPETLCGLALAGANHGTNSLGKVPGIITAEELATLDLSGCELAVLSACETNVGLRRAGQGIQSLQGGLHAAGVRTAITSLWKVDDAATRRLMELFYTKLWKDGLGKADALWRAKMALKNEGHQLRDWAGWVLTGDPD